MVVSNSKLDGTFSHVLVFNISLFFGFWCIGPLKINHGLYILCLKIALQRSKRNFDQRFPRKWHDVKNHICPVSIGMSEYKCTKYHNVWIYVRNIWHYRVRWCSKEFCQHNQRLFHESFFFSRNHARRWTWTTGPSWMEHVPDQTPHVQLDHSDYLWMARIFRWHSVHSVITTTTIIIIIHQKNQRSLQNLTAW